MEKKFLRAIFIITIITFVILVNNVLTPFILGLIFAYAFHPITTKIEKVIKSRILASLIVVLAFIILILFFLVIILPSFFSQFSSLFLGLPKFLLGFKNKLVYLADYFDISMSSITGSLKSNLTTVSEDAVKIFGGIFTSSVGIISFFNIMIIMPIVMYYILCDFNKITNFINGLVPTQYKAKTTKIFNEINHLLSAYVSGQFTVTFCMATYYIVALYIVGLNNSIAIGIITGFLTIIPYVGALLGFITSLIIAYFQFESLKMMVIIAAIFAIGQGIEANYLVPKIMGQKLKISPIWTMFAIICGAHLFGLIGIIIALPVTAILSVIIRELYLYLFVNDSTQRTD